MGRKREVVIACVNACLKGDMWVCVCLCTGREKERQANTYEI